MHHHYSWFEAFSLTAKEGGNNRNTSSTFCKAWNIKVWCLAVCVWCIDPSGWEIVFFLFFLLGWFQFLMHLSRVYGSAVYHSHLNLRDKFSFLWADEYLPASTVMQHYEWGEMAAKVKLYNCNSPTFTCYSLAAAAGCLADSWWE